MKHAIRLLRRLRDLGPVYLHDRATRPETAAEIGSIVAALAILPEPRALAHAAMLFLLAEQIGWRVHYLQVLQREINAELKALGVWS